MVITIGSPYHEATQWAVDVEVDGVKHQLTWGPEDRPAPTQAEIDAAVATLMPPSPYELITEAGNAV